MDTRKGANIIVTKPVTKHQDDPQRGTPMPPEVEDDLTTLLAELLLADLQWAEAHAAPTVKTRALRHRRLKLVPKATK